ncbi:GRB10-interacting GYF protein 2-like [Seriola lalandi dorsalis]|uniref:GRB10-interacting GYF protein 2-like n=1 Tax=Seriola lalandi dorsalis TaxID=1841481 RepID=UPI000C6FAE27|nr:GRB10-interacting GYF protein 2-like [Seriola lalandi dorsalis]XP_056245465.1 GRB10-interacting GYF protein 2-like [Seriola aureovittata]
MTGFSDIRSFLTQHDVTERVKELQRAIQENSLKLEEVRQQRLHVEEEKTQCTREAERRMELMKKNSRVVDVLQQLGHMLQEERRLSEQLHGQDSEDRNQKNEEDRSECFKNRARSLTAEILDTKQRLAEAKARNMAAEALIHPPTRKSKQNQSKPK